MKTFLSAIIILLIVSHFGRAAENDSLLRALDRTIERKQLYIDKKENVIAGLKRRLNDPNLTPRQKYAINKSLLREYRPYIYDPAVHYAMENLELARRIGGDSLIADSKVYFAFVLLTGGMHKEAIEVLDSIDPRHVAGTLAEYYYLCYEQCYLHLSIYVSGTVYEAAYRDKSTNYARLLAESIPSGSDNYFALSRVCLMADNVTSVRRCLSELLERIEPGTHGYAIVESTLADTYKDSHNEIGLREKHLILAAISDFESAVKEYVALSDLAETLYYQGDIARAYKYGTIAMGDANFYNARLRRAELSKTFPILEQAYKSELNRKNDKLLIFIIFISLLALVVLSALVHIYRQRAELRKTRLKLLETNDQLTSANRLLSDANQVKEVYLGRILALCSSYITRLERYQGMVRNRLSTGKVDELRAMSRSPEMIDYEINEFYRNFDRTLLKLYPHFVSEFNRLLRPQERAEPKDDGSALTTEMRIYALVRLGISDSSGIAKILRYAPNTVYTYRHKTRLKAIDKEHFEDDVMKIGL